MLRTVLAGLLVFSAAAACGSREAAPAVAIGTAAGKVVDVSGNVVATREGKPRTLAAGAEVFGDDMIATGGDGAVVVELFHNGARWSVESDRTARVDASLAWGLSKQQAAKPTEHATASAGRNAERSAAETGSTAVPSADAPAAATPMREVASATPADKQPDPPPAPPVRERSTGGRSAGPRGMAKGTSVAVEAEGVAGRAKLDDQASGSLEAPPSEAEAPAPPPQEVIASKLEERKVVPPSSSASPAKPSAPSVRLLVDGRRAALVKCLDPQAANVTVIVRVTKGVARFELTGSGNRTDKVAACIERVLEQIAFAKLDGEASIELGK